MSLSGFAITVEGKWAELLSDWSNGDADNAACLAAIAAAARQGLPFSIKYRTPLGSVFSFTFRYDSDYSTRGALKYAFDLIRSRKRSKAVLNFQRKIALNIAVFLLGRFGSPCDKSLLGDLHDELMEKTEGRDDQKMVLEGELSQIKELSPGPHVPKWTG